MSTLLATLLLEANRTVPTDRLIEAVWGWHAPSTARSQLSIVVSQLRRLLLRAGAPRPVVFTETAGYRLVVTVGEVDALLFEQHVTEAERAVAAGRPAEAVASFRSALGLWRGPALAGVGGGLVGTAATLLAERRAAIQARCIDLELALGRHADLVTELVGLIIGDPFNERLLERLVLALYRCGRVTEALATYQGFRQRLADEVGIEPGPRLAALHRRILNRDPALDPPVATLDPPAAVHPPGVALRHRADDIGSRPEGAGSQPGDAGSQPGDAGSPPGDADPRPARVEPRPGGADPRPADAEPRSGGAESNRPGRRPGGPPARRRMAGRPPRRPGGIPRRPGGQPGGPARRRPSGQDTTAAQPAAELPATPRQVPPAVADFVGREPELSRIRCLLDSDADRSGPAVVVVHGRPGIGKTTLAIRAGRDLDRSHPDGCLYADLVAGDGVPVDPHDVLGAFLTALGVAEGAVPSGRTQRRDLYRSMVAGRRLLVLLDGAVEADQVRPLLPTGAASAALVTARRPPAGLDGAHLVALDVLPVEPAVRLLAAIAPEGVAGDLPAAHRVVQLCDRLPLAIRVAGNRLAASADRSLAQTAERLSDGVHRLDRLADGDRDVRRGLLHAYLGLDTAPATLLRRVGTLPVAEFPGWLAVPLLDSDRSTAERALADLVDAGLVHPVPDRRTGLPRYRVPELVRLYARERVDSDDPPPLRATAHRRAYWWLLDLALRADRQLPEQLFPAGALGLPPRYGPDTELLHAVDADPLGWLTAERHLVVGAAGQSARVGDTELAWRLAVAPTNFLYLRGLVELWQRALEHGRAAVPDRSAGGRGPAGHGRSGAGLAQALLSLSNALLLLSGAETAAAWTAARNARRLFDELDDPSRAAACATVGWLAGQPRSGGPATSLADPHTEPTGAYTSTGTPRELAGARPAPVAGARTSPLGERDVTRLGTDGAAPPRTAGTLRGIVRRIGVAPRVVPSRCPTEQPEPLPRRTGGGHPAPRPAPAPRAPQGSLAPQGLGAQPRTTAGQPPEALSAARQPP
ncbi:BTAD domain-containing putative transcriptional regulator [Plantactinospora sp. WMMC1484]|uniref:AfsR/SARP family transcriptional regulator n=1 Tax=Plantactinospora sp. WMMC1484 TaxID=3404122 RepID=UPI003BF537A4